MIARFHYDDETLGQLLHDASSSVESSLAQHVETCEQCQARLETITQDGLTWEEAGELLRGDESSVELADNEDRNLEAHASPTFLQPSDHPGSFGRFGRYEIMEFLGRGGMGIVMRGFDPALNRYSAVKVLAPELASSAAARKRFSREAKSAAAVVHPHVVPIQTVDEHNGLPYLVMPVVEGTSLQQRVDRTGPLPVIEVVRIAAQIAEGLAAAHAQGLIHRDIKPANILLENGVERVQITDFGLARAADDASMTRSGVIAGTPQYMSPEQAHGDELDHRSDLFSLGSVMVFMLTGRSPFRAENTMGVLNRIANDEPRRLRSINPDIPTWLQSIVMRLLEKSPEKRFASAEATATELNRRLAELQDPAPKEFGRNGRVRRDWLPLWRVILGSGALAAIIYMAIVVLQTTDGTIRIETNADFDGKVPLVIRQGDEVIRRLTVESQGVSTRVRAGSYSIDFDGEQTSFELLGTRATVKAGGVWIVKIDYQSNEGNDSWKALSDPSKVHQLANEDTRHGRYEAALDKVLWYWDNAVAIQPSQSAVRRSFLLSDWLTLGEAFPPALEKLKSIRDQLEASILSKNQVRVRSEDFADFAALNDTLRDEQRTVHVFKEIEARDPEDAKRLRYWLPDAVDGKPDVVDGAGIDIDTSAREGTPVAQIEEGLPLDEAVEQFNQKNIRKNLGFDQPPLTALEIVTCARWKLQTDTELTPETRAGLSTLATERQLPLQWTIEGGYAAFPAGEREVKGFQIFLMDHSRDVAVFVRRRYLSSLPPSIAPSDLTPDPDAMPLASAITEFNAIHNTIDGVRQPPLTLDEVLAAIASWSSRRDEAPVDNATYEAFLNIAATCQLPHGVKFEVIPNFGSVTGESFKVWSVRILMPLISKPGWTYAFSIREQYVAVDSIDTTTICWGPPADNGLQAGVRLVPSQPEYRIGQRIGVEFFYRSTTGRAIEADLPNAFTFKEIKVVDSDGSELKAIDHQQKLVGGWMGTKIGEQPTRRIGQSIQILSSVPTESKTAVESAHESGAGATILAEAGQTCRLRFLVRNYATEVGEPLPTGEVEFRVLGQAFIFRSPSN